MLLVSGTLQRLDTSTRKCNEPQKVSISRENPATWTTQILENPTDWICGFFSFLSALADYNKNESFKALWLAKNSTSMGTTALPFSASLLPLGHMPTSRHSTKSEPLSVMYLLPAIYRFRNMEWNGYETIPELSEVVQALCNTSCREPTEEYGLFNLSSCQVIFDVAKLITFFWALLVVYVT